MTYALTIPAESYAVNGGSRYADNVSQTEAFLDLAASTAVVLLDATEAVAGNQAVDEGARELASQLAVATRPWGYPPSTGGDARQWLPWMFATKSGGGVFTAWVRSGERAQRQSPSTGLAENIPAATIMTRALNTLLPGVTVLAPTGATDAFTGDPIYRRAVFVGDSTASVHVRLRTREGLSTSTLPLTANATAVLSAYGDFDAATLAGAAADGTRWFDLTRAGVFVVRAPVATTDVVALSTIARGTERLVAESGGAWVVVAEIL